MHSLFWTAGVTFCCTALLCQAMHLTRHGPAASVKARPPWQTCHTAPPCRTRPTQVVGAAARQKVPTGVHLLHQASKAVSSISTALVQGLFLGSDAVARNRDTLRQAGITHVVNCVGFLYPAYFKDELSYKVLFLQGAHG